MYQGSIYSSLSKKIHQTIRGICYKSNLNRTACWSYFIVKSFSLFSSSNYQIHSEEIEMGTFELPHLMIPQGLLGAGQVLYPRAALQALNGPLPPGSHIILTVQARLGSNPRNQPGSAFKEQHDQKLDLSLRQTERLHLSRFALTSQIPALRLTIICPFPFLCARPWSFGTMEVPGGWSWSKAGVTTAVPEFTKIFFQVLGLLKSRDADSMLPNGFQWSAGGT